MSLKEVKIIKRIGNIYYKIYDIDNIKKAILIASKGKKRRKEVKKIIEHIDYYSKILQNMLINKTYIPSKYKIKKIIDGSSRKERIIYKPRFFPDQCIHWALMLQIESILEKPMYYYSCASRKGKGTILGVSHIKKILRQDPKNTKYCLKIDVVKYFPNIDKEILKKKVRTLIKCKDTLWLIDSIINSCDKGLPIGNYTSQGLANFYLTDLDHYIKEKLHVKYYIRYMDDMVLFHKNKKELHKISKKIENFLTNEHLKMKGNWQVFKTDSRPLDFLGYKFYRDHTTLRGTISLRIKRRIKKIYKKGYINKKDAGAVISYYGWIKLSNSRKYYKKYIKKYITLRQCKKVLKQKGKGGMKIWKNKRLKKDYKQSYKPLKIS